MITFNNVYKGKRVLITGHTGFKGSWLSLWLHEIGADVLGYALAPKTPDDHFIACNLESRVKHVIGDIRDIEHLERVFTEFQPEIVFHLAAQPIVLESYDEPRETIETNVMGTVNLLECCRITESVQTILIITSDKCYENREQMWSYREMDPLGGRDPYSASKACCEILTRSWRDSFMRGWNKNLATVRAGNVIGGGDFQHYRLIPDCIRSLREGKPIPIRSPFSTRPWQHVLEPLHGYLTLAMRLHNGEDHFADAWNFGPDPENIVTVQHLAEVMIRIWGHGDIDMSMANREISHEAKLLSLDITKARTLLNWKPVLNFNQTVQFTVEWYREEKPDYQLSLNQLRKYCELRDDEE